MKTLISFITFLVIVSYCSCSQVKENPQVVMKTELGDIVVEVYEDRAPVTAGNFLKLVDENRFEGATFYRVVTMDNQPDDSIKIEVIQGGLLLRQGDLETGRQGDRQGDRETKRQGAVEELEPIEHETTIKTGIRHKDGVISMARAAPGTATSEFFICIGDQPELDFGGRRNPDGQGFAAFGRVIRGKEIVRKIQMQPSESQMLIKPVSILNTTRVKTD